jgi:hypothetical protein
MRWSEWFADRLRATRSPYAAYFHDGLEMQFQPTTDESLLDGWIHPPFPYRIPADGHINPTPNDGQLAYHPDLVATAGVSWWNWRDGLTEGCAFDFDFGHGPHGLDKAGITEVDALAQHLPYVMNCTSKSGRGRHWLVRVASPMPARIRADHIRNCQAIKDRVAADLCVDLDQYVCSFGGIQYIYARNVARGSN